jgi:hypothetical protein
MAEIPDSRATGNVYRWHCPICEETGYVTKAQPSSGAIDVLTSHIRATAGGGHGARHEVPDGCDPISLENNVESYER